MDLGRLAKSYTNGGRLTLSPLLFRYSLGRVDLGLSGTSYLISAYVLVTSCSRQRVKHE